MTDKVDIKRPTDPRQLLHLTDMNAFFEGKFEACDIDEAILMNYHYGMDNTTCLEEFCDVMHTMLYWLNDNYSDMFMVEKAGEAINLCSKIDDLDEGMYRIDIVFGAWLSFVLCDSAEMRNDFLSELGDLGEGGLVDRLIGSDDPSVVETSTIAWVKTIVDPVRKAAYSYYMLYLMFKAANRKEGCAVISHAISKVHMVAQAATRLYVMNQHNLSMN